MNPSLRIIDALEIVVIVDNVVDFSGALLVESAQPPAKWVKDGNINHLRAGHGLSMLVRTYVEQEKHEVMYDTGPSPEVLHHNVLALRLDLSDVESIVMSHGHWDHFGGLEWALGAIDRNQIPVYIHPIMLSPRRIVRESESGQIVRELQKTPTIDDIRRRGGAPVMTNQAITVADGTLLRTGEIPRETSYEHGIPGHQALVDGKWIDDSTVIDDSTLIANIGGKGLVVITGCAHAGVINSIREAIRLTGEDRIHAVIGGIHLMGADGMKPIDSTIRDLKSFNPDVVACGHCTGWRAQHALSSAFRNRYVQNSVGTMFRF